MQVWKYRLDERTTTVVMPKGATPISVGIQDNVACMWALVDKSKPFEKRTFSIYGTGWDLPDKPENFIGTIHEDNGLVSHVFEQPNDETN